jgi:DNA modification methylase
MVADNAASQGSELDLAMINLEVPSLGPDFDIDLLGIDDFALDASDKYADKDADEVPETRKTDIKLGDLFQLGNHRLLCGDATSKADVERLMSGEKADMVYTDPPYGIDEQTDRAFASRTRLAKGNSFKKIQGDDSIETALKAFELIHAPVVCYWGGNYFAHELPPSACWIVWDKRVEENQRDMNSDCEMAWVSHPSKKSVRIFRHLWKGMIKGSEVGQGRVHPTQKPIALAEWCFNELDPDGKSVLDVFLGSGSTLIACEKTNRRCFGMEIDPSYIDVIIRRWEKFTGQKAVKCV